MLAAWIKPLGVLLAVLGIAGAGAYVNGARWSAKYEQLRTEHVAFKAQVAVLGEQAKEAAVRKAAYDAKLKARIDDENKRIAAALRTDVARLRHERDAARGSLVPPVSADAGRPDLACFDRTGLESALREFVDEIRGFVDEGAKATLDLDTAKRWNAERD